MEAINLEEKFGTFDQHWTPYIIGELNGQYVKLAKVSEEFVWHDHEEEDELFFVMRGTLHLDFKDRPTQQVGPGEILIVPKGVPHRPWTKDGEEVWLMLFEPKATKHTGHIEDEKTVNDQQWI